MWGVNSRTVPSPEPYALCPPERGAWPLLCGWVGRGTMEGALPDVLHDVDHQPGVLKRMEVDHVADRAVRDGRAVDRDGCTRTPTRTTTSFHAVRFATFASLFTRLQLPAPPSHGGLREGALAVLVRPVADRVRVVDLLAQPPNHLRWAPHLARLLLLLEHLVQERHEPVLELAVVVVGHKHVADTVAAPARAALSRQVLGVWCCVAPLRVVILGSALVGGALEDGSHA